MEFIEHPAFSKALPAILSDKEYRNLQIELLERPDAGVLIPGGGGLRKLRVGSRSKGKRGGSRVIYYWYKSPERIDLCRIYEKSDQSDVPKKELKDILKNIKK